SKRPGIQSNFLTGTRLGVRNLAPKHVGRKEYLMEMPVIFKGESLTRLAQGAAVGAVATMIIGFNWGGWVLGKTAENNATMLVNTALVKAYGPVCIERFKQQPNVEAKWAELTKVDTWRRESYIKDSGFATPPGSALPNAAIADACADALSKIISMQTPAAK
ncbi:MAG: hypothetical protein WBE53_03665, partial [Pseudolabrys sp.]